MFRAIKVVSPVLDIQLRHAKDLKHIKIMTEQKPQIDVSTPPVNPRIIRYQKMIKKSRKAQADSENERIRLINDLHEKQIAKRSQTSASNRKTLLDWSHRIPLSSESPPNDNLQNDIPRPQTPKKKKQLLTDEGMIVFDSTINSPIRTPSVLSPPKTQPVSPPNEKENGKLSIMSEELFNNMLP